MNFRVGWVRRPYVIALALFGLVLLLRVPFATSHLWAWDSVLYARALEQGFHVAADPAAARPHPPGYIWYLAAAALVRLATQDSNAALVLVSMLASALGSALLYLLARSYVRPSVAALIAVAYAVSPVTWMYSEVAYPYTVLGLLSIALGWIFLTRRSAVLASLAFGIASGARQDLLLLLLPLWLWSVRPGSLRALAGYAALVAAGAGTWLLPTVALSGGPAAYVSALLTQAEVVSDTYSAPARGLRALLYNAGFTLEAIGWGLGLLAIPLLVGAGLHARSAWRARRVDLDDPATALVLWTLPALAFYALIHIGEWGYVLSVMPALLLAAGIGLERTMHRLPAAAWALAACASVVVPAAIFLAGDDAYHAVVGDADFSAAALARHDERVAADVRYVRDRFAPAGTLIVTRDDELLVRYYLPEFRTYRWDPDPYRSEAKRRRMLRTTNVVVLTPGLQPVLQGEVRRVEIAPGIVLSFTTVERGAVLELTGERYSVQDTPSVY